MYCSVFEDRHRRACQLVWYRGALEVGWAGGHGAHFYNSIDDFQLPSRRRFFDLHRRFPPCTLILLFDLYSLLPRRSDFRNFPSSRPIIAIVAPFRLIGHVETFGKSMTNCRQTLFIVASNCSATNSSRLFCSSFFFFFC